jgi:hypothetical protein
MGSCVKGEGPNTSIVLHATSRYRNKKHAETRLPRKLFRLTDFQSHSNHREHGVSMFDINNHEADTASHPATKTLQQSL